MDAAVALERCLEPDELLALVDGGCDEGTRRAALGHATSCEACRLAIAAVARAVRSDLDGGSRGAELPVPEAMPEHIGRHRIVRTLGRGGMGVVYEAFDPRLRRSIAIKRMHAGTRELGPRLRREAQVLARLADPHVVAVLEAGPDWIAMELVEGETLASWQRGKPWRAIVSAYLQAARGLAAAHAVGVVHRDFKPHNVLIDHGDDARVRVADFGLAAAELERSEPAAAEIDALTTASGMVGTPAYMSPEQFLGRRADAASDQFSFCVALHEALTGLRPFAGDDVVALCAAVLAGKRRTRPRTGVPAAIWRVVDRGLELEPARRWPSMHALVAALARAAERRRGPVLAAIGLAGLAVLALVDMRAPACGDDEAMTSVWNPARAQTVRTALLESKVVYAEATAGHALTQLDDYAEQWTQLRAELCAEGRLGDDAITCLDDRVDALAGLLQSIEAGDREVVLVVGSAVRRLPSVRGCEHPSSTAPRSPAARELARELVDERVTLPMRMIEDSDLPRLAQLVARAQELGDAVLIAEAIGLLGSAQAVGGHWELAMPILEDAYLRNYELGNDALACELARDLALGASWQGHGDEAVRWARLAAAVATDPAQRADVAAVEGELLFELGRVEEAEVALALALADDAPSDAKISALTMTGQIHAMSGRLAEAEVVLHESIALIERDAGPEHPDLARPLNMLGVVQIQRGELHRAVATLEHARDISAAQLGADHPMVAHVTGNLAIAQGDLGDREGSYQSLLRVKASFERAEAVNEPQLAITLGNLATQALAAGRPNDALRHAEQAISLDRKLGKPVEASGAAAIRAKAQRQLGDRIGALRSFEELLALHHEHQPDNDDKLGWAELAIAELAHQLGREPLAAEHLARALEHYGRSTATSPGERARAERIAARLRAGDRERAADHLRRAWTLLGQGDANIQHDIRDLGERMALVDTWRELGGADLVAWSRVIA